VSSRPELQLKRKEERKKRRKQLAQRSWIQAYTLVRKMRVEVVEAYTPSLSKV
jgi:hypothetical protein